MFSKTTAVEVAGWEEPIYHAMQQVPTFKGVPMGVFVADALTCFFVMMFWWPVLVVGLLVYGVALIGTAYEPRWLAILWEYWLYHAGYEA